MSVTDEARARCKGAKEKANKMKNYTALLTAMVLAAPATSLLAQDQDADQPQPPRRPRIEQRDDRGPAGLRDGQLREGSPRVRRPQFDGQGPDAPKPPLPPVIGVLDANHDGVIDETEIANAPAALKKLDKNDDGKLTREELRPLPPQGMPREGGPGPNGSNGPRRQPRQNFRGGEGRGNGPLPGDAPEAPRRPRPPQGEQE